MTTREAPTRSPENPIEATMTPTLPPPALPTTMRAVTAHRYGGAEVVSVEEVPVPNPGKGQVLIRTEASSLNALDWRILTGTPYLIRLMFGLRRPKRITPGADVAGTVVAVGTDVADLAVGDDIFAEVAGGGCAPYTVVKAKHAVRKPAGVSFEHAAATPVAGLTAIQGLRTEADVQPGERVLVNGAAGGVGTFAVQIAAALGAEVVGVCSTRNAEMVGSIGATEVVDYTVDDVVARYAGADETRFDVMIDNVGNRSVAECQRLLRPNGRYVAVSGPMENPWFDPFPHMIRGFMGFRRSDQTFHQFTASPNRADLTSLGEMLADGRVVPQIQRTVGLDGVADALAEIGTGHTRAKIVVRPS